MIIFFLLWTQITIPVLFKILLTLIILGTLAASVMKLKDHLQTTYDKIAVIVFADVIVVGFVIKVYFRILRKFIRILEIEEYGS